MSFVPKINDWAILSFVLGAIILFRLLLSPYWVYTDVCRERAAAVAELKTLKEHPLQIEVLKSHGLITALVTNKGHREERVETVEIRSLDTCGNVSGTFGNGGKGQRSFHHSFKRCQGLPHVMPPRSSFEVEFLLSLGTFQAYGQKAFYAWVKLEDGTTLTSDLWKLS